MEKRLLVLNLIVLLFLTLSPVQAQGPTPGGLIIGEDLIVARGETILGNPDTIVLGGGARVEQGGGVLGDLAVIGGDAEIEGGINGDLLVFGGDVQLGAQAIIRGDVFVPFGQLEREEGAEVQGQVIRGPGMVRKFFRFESWSQVFLFSLLSNILQTLLLIVGLVAVGLIAVALFPRQTYQVRTTLLENPAPSVGVGCLGLIVIPLLGILLFFTCLGIPVSILLFAGLIVALVFGWVGAGVVIGERLLVAIQAKQRSPVMMVALGTLLITVASFIPCFGTIFGLLVAAWGLGAVLLTRFGTQRYPSTSPSQSKPA